jgi:hypothetical protein
MKYRPIIRLLTQLRAANVPFIYQVLVEKTDTNEYVASVRLCVTDGRFAVASHDGFYRLYDKGHPHDLADFFGEANFNTNFNVGISDYYRYISSDSEWLHTADHVSVDKADRALDVYTGSDEYRRLFGCTLDYPDIYKEHIGYPKFPIDRDALPHFIALPQMLYDESPWNSVNSRHAPRQIEINGPIGDSSWSQTLDTKLDKLHRQHQSGSSATAGSRGHGAGLRAAIDILEQQGYTLVMIDQDGSSIPDAIGVNPDGERVWLEYETPNGKPENYLKNISRAIIAGIKPILVIGEKDTTDTDSTDSTDLTKVADRVYNNLYQPFRDTKRLGTWLYNRGQDITLDDGSQVVLPRGATKARWYVTYEDDEWRLICQADGKTIATGPAEESVTTFDYDCPRYSKDDGMHIIKRADGTELVRKASKPEALQDWTLASVPHLPVRLSYAGVTKLMIQRWDSLQEPDVERSWTTTTGKMERYRASTKDFLETFLIDMDGEHLRSEAVHDHYKFILGDMTERKLPSHKKFGEARNDEHYPTKRLGADGAEGTALKDVQ